MIQEKGSPSSSSEDDFVRLDDEMDREEPTGNELAETHDEEDEEPLLSHVFAVNQLKQGAMTAASFFSWGYDAMKVRAAALSENEQVKQMLETTKAQTGAMSENASQLWESTKPKREEIARTAASISLKVQPHIQKMKEESARAMESISASLSEAVGSDKDSGTSSSHDA